MPALAPFRSARPKPLPLALLVAGLFAALGRPTTAQSLEWRPDVVTAKAYVGAGPSSFRGPALGGGLEVSTPYGLLSARTVSARETLALLPSRTPVERNTDLGLLYGWRVGLGAGLYVSAGAGISSVVFTRRGRLLRGKILVSAEYEKLRERVTGTPVEVRLGYGNDLGGGVFVSWFRNYNRLDDYGGVLIGVSLGY